MFATLILSTIPFMLLFAGAAFVALVAVGGLLVKFPSLVALAAVYAFCLRAGAARATSRKGNEDATPVNPVNLAEAGFRWRPQKNSLALWWPTLAWAPESTREAVVATAAPSGRRKVSIPAFPECEVVRN